MTGRVKNSKDRRAKPRSSSTRMLVRMDVSNPPFREGLTVKLRHLNNDLFEVTSWVSGMQSRQFQQPEILRSVHEPERGT